MKLKSILLLLLSLILCLFRPSPAIAQTQQGYYSLTLLSHGNTVYRGQPNEYNGKNGDWILNRPWKYSPGDDSVWAHKNFDDSKWDTTVATELNRDKLKPQTFNGYGWFRIKLFVDSVLRNKPLQLIFAEQDRSVKGAADVFVDGKLSFSVGIFSTKAESEKTDYMGYHTIIFDSLPYHTIAIRYSNFTKLNDTVRNKETKYMGFQPEILLTEAYNTERGRDSYLIISIVYLTITFIHLMLFFFFRELRANLFYSLLTFSFGAFYFVRYQRELLHDSHTLNLLELATPILIACSALFLLAFYYSVLYRKFPKIFWIATSIAALIVLFILCARHNTINYVVYSILIFFFFLFVLVESIRVVIKAIIEKRDGAWIIVTGIGFIVLFGITYTIEAMVTRRGIFTGRLQTFNTVLQVYCFACIPVSMSIYLARTFARTSKHLTVQLAHVKQLSKQNLELIRGQKDKLEVQVKEKTAEILLQRDDIERKKNALELKNKEVTDSINYAKRIQSAMLPKTTDIKKSLPNSFVLFKPKAIVSGDFYFFSQTNETIFLAAADCTGHGVPGAFMSMIGTEKLSDAVTQSTKPGDVLKLLNKGIKSTLHQSLDIESTRDGMDIALCSISGPDASAKKFTYSGANRPLWIIRKNSKEIEEIKATKKAIGGFTEADQEFTTHHVELNTGDTFYLFSDGYADQFGGEKGKKLTTKIFKEMLLDIQHKSMPEQEKELEAFIEEWMGQEEQLDDILIIGVRV